VHVPEVPRDALALSSAGVNDCEIARRLGIARTTVRDIRRRAPPADPRVTCAHCWTPVPPVRFTDADYAELLGL